MEEGAGSTTPFWAGGLKEIEDAPASDDTAEADAAGNAASDEDDVPIKMFPPPGTDEAAVAETAVFIPLEAGWADVTVEEADGAEYSDALADVACAEPEFAVCGVSSGRDDHNGSPLTLCHLHCISHKLTPVDLLTGYQ
jgi:hypothetical protein